MTLLRCLTILISCNSLMFAGEPQKPVKRSFPARLTVASVRPLDDGRQEVELNLALEDNVEIFANPVGAFPESCAMKTWVVTKDGYSVPAEVIYPKPNRSEVTETDGSEKVNIFALAELFTMKMDGQMPFFLHLHHYLDCVAKTQPSCFRRIDILLKKVVVCSKK